MLTVSKAELFLRQAAGTFYYNMYVLGLDTGMRIGELKGRRWFIIDWNKKVLYIRRSLCYFSKEGKYVFE